MERELNTYLGADERRLRSNSRSAKMPEVTRSDQDRTLTSDVYRLSAATTAWQIHASISDLTGKADAKASMALSVELAVVAGTIAFASTGQSSTSSGGVALMQCGTALVLLGALLAIAAVLPRTKGSEPTGGHENFIYFGSLRHWTTAELSTALIGTDSLGLLCEQLVAMSRIAWRKMILVKYSLLVSGAGLVLIATTALMAL